MALPQIIGTTGNTITFQPSTSACATFNVAGDLHAGDGSGTATGTLNVLGGATVNVSSWLWAGVNVGNAIVNVTNSTINVAGVYELGSHYNATGVMNMSNGTVTVGSDFHNSDYWNDGGTAAPTAVTNMNGASRLTVNGTLYNGYWGSQGTLNVNDTSSLTVHGWLCNQFNWGDETWETLPCFINIAANGTVTQSTSNTDGNPNDDTHVMLPNLGGTGTLNNSGTFTTTRYVVLGDSDVGSGVPGSGIINLNGGTFACPGFRLGWDSTRVTAASTGIVNFNGGILQMNGATLNGWSGTNTGAATNDFFYNPYGGTLQLNVMLGGAKIDSNGYQMYIPEPLVSGVAGDGGLTKLGAGTLTLSAANTYVGVTTVAAGSLVLSGNAAQAPVLSVGGANLQAGTLVFDYSPAGSTDPLATIRSDLHSGLIHSSTLVAGQTAIAYSDSGTAVTLQRDVLGDCNLDNTVNLADLNILLNNYGKSSATWSMGDFNYDGVVNLADLNLLLNNYGRTFAGDTVSERQFGRRGHRRLAGGRHLGRSRAGHPRSARRRPGRLACLRLA